jgi:aminoglycoside phosphotransferase (APT) family kinase protein
MTMHEREIYVSDEAARELILDQFPHWAHQPIRRVRSSGTVNAIFRIGAKVAARFPLLGTDPADTHALLVREAAASAEFVRHSPFPAPVPIGIGVPGHGYPLPWSVQSWIPGAVATDDDPSDSEPFARDLASLIAALRAADSQGRAFTGHGRGGELTDHDAWVEECLRNSVHLLDVPRMARLWQHFRDLPRTSPDVMTHGDLIPANVLVKDMRLAGVLDCGGFAAADPALDVIAGWHLLEDGPRSVFRAELGCDDLEWERSKAWAFEQAMGAVWYYVHTNPAMSGMGRRTLARIVTTTSPTG